MKFHRELRQFFRLFLVIGGAVMAIGLISWFYRLVAGWLDDEKPAPPVKSFGILLPSRYHVHGIDVSKHQGRIDWLRVKKMKSNGQHISFAFIKATEGITRQDKRFAYNWEQARKQGIVRGAYHFYYPSRNAGLQALNFMGQVKLLPGDLPPVVDIEHANGKGKKEIVKGLKTMLDDLETAYGQKPIIYSNVRFYETFLADNFQSYPLWIAGYFDHERFEDEFGYEWSFWQHSERGHVDGIKGMVDFNVFVGTEAGLKALATHHNQ